MFASIKAIGACSSYSFHAGILSGFMLSLPAMPQQKIRNPTSKQRLSLVPLLFKAFKQPSKLLVKFKHYSSAKWWLIVSFWSRIPTVNIGYSQKQ